MEKNTAIVTKDNLIWYAGRVYADYRSWGSGADALASCAAAALRRVGVEVLDLRTPEQRRAAFTVLEREAAEHRARRAVEAGLDIETAGDLIDGARTVA
jgi:hypothetical protein